MTVDHLGTYPSQQMKIPDSAKKCVVNVVKEGIKAGQCHLSKQNCPVNDLLSE